MQGTRRLGRKVKPFRKVPSSIKLCGKKWTVEITPKLDGVTDPWILSHTDIRRGEFLHGLIYWPRRMIFINSYLEPQDQWETFVHELLHACFPTQCVIVKGSTEERIVQALAPRMCEALGQLFMEAK